MKNILSQIGIGLVMFFGVAVAAVAVIIVWLASLVYSAFKWVFTSKKQDTRHPVTVMQNDYQKFLAKHNISTKKPRHNIRGRDGRFVKRSINVTPESILSVGGGIPININA